jgi:hypothetical protein
VNTAWAWRDFSVGMQVDYKEYDPMQKVCIVYSARALRNARKGNTDLALADYRKAAATIGHAASEDLAMSEYLTTVCLDQWARSATSAAEERADMRAPIAKLVAELPSVNAKAGVGTDFALIKATIERIRTGKTGSVEAQELGSKEGREQLGPGVRVPDPHGGVPAGRRRDVGAENEVGGGRAVSFERRQRRKSGHTVQYRLGYHRAHGAA